jgi:hypothetical protein
MRYLLTAGAATAMALLIAGTGATAKMAGERVAHGGLVYGPSERLSGTYFTNFENSRFTRCPRQGCSKGAPREDFTVDCTPDACRDLERRIENLNGSHDNWGTFEIVFQGRRAIRRHPLRYLGDSDQDVLIERIETFKLIDDRRPEG